MRSLLTTLAFCLVAFGSYGQALWRNFFTTNYAPVVEVVAGTNITVQATTPNVFTRRFTVNAGTNGGSGTVQTNISWTAVTNLQSSQMPYTVITNAPWLTNVYGSNVIGAVSEAVHATNADTAVTSTFVLTSTLTNHVYGTNVTGAVAEAAHATNADSSVTATFVTTGTLTNKVTGANVVGSVAESTHATNADNATVATFVSTGTLTNKVTGANVVGSVAEATHATNADLASFVSGTLSNNITGNAATATKATYVSDISTNQLPQSAITNQTPRVVGITIDGGGSAITTGVKGYLEVPYACTISAATMMADQNGGCGVNVWRTNSTGYPPTSIGKISAAASPVLSNTNWSRDATLTGWTTTLAAGDILGFNVESNETITRLTVQLKLQP